MIIFCNILIDFEAKKKKTRKILVIGNENVSKRLFFVCWQVKIAKFTQIKTYVIKKYKKSYGYKNCKSYFFFWRTRKTIIKLLWPLFHCVRSFIKNIVENKKKLYKSLVWFLSRVLTYKPSCENCPNNFVSPAMLTLKALLVFT